MGYCSASDVKTHAQIDYAKLGFSSDGEYDTFLGTLIQKADAMIDNYCGVSSGFFAAGKVTITDERLDWRPSRKLALANRMISGITSIYCNKAGYGSTEDWEVIDTADYILYPDEGVIFITGDVPAIPERSIKVSYTAGYTAVPYDITLASIEICSNYLHTMLQRRVNPVVNINEFAVKIVTSEAFTKDIKTLLAHYRRFTATTG